MSKLTSAVLFGFAVAVVTFFFSDSLIMWSGGKAHENIVLTTVIYGFLAMLSVYWPKSSAVLAFFLIFLTGLLVVVLGESQSGRVEKVFVVILHALPFFLPLLWSTGYFDLFRNAKRTSA
ncbi:MAG TPA: hypothetical protein PK109_02745 [Candidatus Paceibacterota bacterium]|nr:hypothetical protein [Candidatus Paceibacterota bacterium]